jgi:RNA polymerase sigma factor (TIGR02999 family)
MSTTGSHEITQLLLSWSQGDAKALDDLMPLVHLELKRLARRRMRAERNGHTLQTNGLVNEAYIRLVDATRIQWQNRAHFFAVSARLMRQILVDYARSRRYQKRGGNLTIIPLDHAPTPRTRQNDDVLAIHDALLRLSEIDERKGQVVELRFFGGLTEDQAAEVLNVSSETVKRDWRLAKAWLRRELNSAGA